jgi:uncharacterized membrane protein
MLGESAQTASIEVIRSRRGYAGSTTRAVIARRAVPLSVTGIVLGSAALRLVMALPIRAAWIFPDELVYRHLAQSFAGTGAFAVRGEPFSPWSFGPLYPIVISPAYRLFDPTTAYLVVQATNCLLFSLAAIPAYFLARRVLTRRHALLLSGLAVLVPSAVYTSKLMTESLAYPLFLLSALAIVRAIEHPTWRRELGALAAIGAATLARGQLVVLLPAFLLTLVVLCSCDQRDGASPSTLRGRLAAYRLTWTAASVALTSVLIASATGYLGRIAGGHSEAFSGVRPWALAKSFVDHLAEFDLYVGALPIAATILVAVAAFRPGSAERTLRAICLLAGTLTVLLAATSARYLVAVEGRGGRSIPVFDRYVFYATPLLLIGLVAWIERGMPRPRRLTVATAVGVAAAPLALPFADLLTGRQWGTNSSTVGLVPWGIVRMTTHSLWPVYGLMTLGAAGLAYLLCRSINGRRMLTIVLGNFAVLTICTQLGNTAISAQARRLGIGNHTASSWIDSITGPNADVATLWSGSGTGSWKRWYTVWESEFFNKSLRRVYVLHEPMQYELPQIRVSESGGRLYLPNDKPLVAQYVLTDARTSVAGTRVGADASTRMVLYRVNGEVSLR